MIGHQVPLLDSALLLHRQSAENLSEMLPQLTAQRLSAVRVRGGSRAGSFVDGRLPEMSNFYCHPGRAGGPPLVG